MVDNGGSGTNLITNNQQVLANVAYTAPTGAGHTTLSNGGTGLSATVAYTIGETMTNYIAAINAQSATTGISAQADAAGTGITLLGTGSGAITATDSTALGPFTSTTAKTLTTGASSAENTSNYVADAGTGANAYVTQTGNETVQFQTSAGSATVTLGTGTSLSAAISAINAKTSGLGVYAVLNKAGDGISFQGQNSFSVTDTANAAAEGIFGAAGLTTPTNLTGTAPTSGSSNNATAAIAAINAAIANLGLVQGSVGAGQNKLQYATNLAQSQITSYSAAESQIRDADVAAQAANLTKAQVLVQTSVAALAQANSAPQSILKLLQ